MNAAWDWHVFGDDDNDQELYQPQVESRPSTSNKKKPGRSSSSVHSVPSHSSGSHYNSDYEDGAYEGGGGDFWDD